MYGYIYKHMQLMLICCCSDSMWCFVTSNTTQTMYLSSFPFNDTALFWLTALACL